LVFFIRKIIIFLKYYINVIANDYKKEKFYINTASILILTSILTAKFPEYLEGVYSIMQNNVPLVAQYPVASATPIIFAILSLIFIFLAHSSFKKRVTREIKELESKVHTEHNKLREIESRLSLPSIAQLY